MEAIVKRKIIIKIPECPPSLNLYYIYVNSRKILTSRARTYRKMVEILALTQIREPIMNPIKLTIHFSFTTRRRRDLSNLLKLLEDSCNNIIWGDDSQVVELIATKEIGCKEEGVILIAEEII